MNVWIVYTVWGITNNADMNILVHSSEVLELQIMLLINILSISFGEHIYAFLLDIYLRSAFPGS